MTREVVKDIGNKSREFFEFILPPVDFIINDDKLIVKIDVPGFDKTELDLSLEGQILSIHAEKNEDEVKGEVIWKQRPKKLEKKIKIPIKIDDSKGKNNIS